ncbi:hypothetical protein ACR1PO_15530 [Chryseobacterium sp. RRHN12]|uniref:hypothetical protein n=1 Tax=Chryseobacterium sp. RRHN12 TaxID=3437884 RepID=UPI003D9B276D
MDNHKYKEGQKVIYRGIIGEIEGLSKSVYGTLLYDLVSIEDSELTCSADEEECELYEDQEFDQREGLTEAYLASERIRNTVASVK